MHGRRGPRVPATWFAGLFLIAALAPAPARAFDYFNGKLQIHGYVAEEIRTLGKNLSTDQQWDLSQWYNIANIELEANPFPNGLGKLEILTFYVRAEARYDCVWTRACGMFPSVNTYGNRAEKLPNRLIDGHAAGYTGVLKNGDSRRASDVNRDNYTLANRYDPDVQHNSVLRFDQLPNFVSLFGNGSGPNLAFEPIVGQLRDDPPSYYFDGILNHCKFGVKNSRGGENGQVWDVIGPWNPGCEIEENGSLRFKPNPMSANEFIPVLAGVDRIANTGDECNDPRVTPPTNIGCPGSPGFRKIPPFGYGALPYRPVPFHLSTERGVSHTEAQGLYLPSSALAQELRSGRLDSINQNFSQAELEWNRGASQQDEKELKEAYADIEMFEGRLWLRLGKQTIVWGKTELFRNTDQFNPQDFAMASIPSLEESRIGLWSARGTWSFYNVGKFEDVRLELAMNLDGFEPADLGRCGEPYAVELVCNISFGYFAHGFAGAGLAGQELPPSPWKDTSGIEGGARLEFRYGKFSYQISDFYGYDDFPHPKRISTYERNADPETGRLRRMGAQTPCTTGYEPACLGIPNSTLRDASGNPLRNVDTDGDGKPDLLVTRSNALWKTGDLVVDTNHTADVLVNHPANQTAYAFANILCGTAGYYADPRLCGFVAFDGKSGPGAVVSTVAMGASALAAGNGNAALSAFNNGFLCTLRIGTTQNKSPGCFTALRAALRALNVDPSDCGVQQIPPNSARPCLLPSGQDLGVFSDGGGSAFNTPNVNPALYAVALGASLAPEQEALLGCGPFLQADCDVDGIDFLNAEASVIVQSWPGFDGTPGTVDTYDERDTSFAHPGTVGFKGGPVATRYAGGKLRTLPGARGPGDAGYDPSVDGCIGPGPYGCNAGDVVQVNPNRDGTNYITFTRVRDAFSLTNPINGQLFRTELAALSHNLLVVFTTGGANPKNPNAPTLSEFDVYDPYGFGLIQNPNSPYFGQVRPGVNPSLVDGTTAVACGIYKPQYCSNVQGFLSSIGGRRKAVRAGGNGFYGRRDFAWDSGGELVLDYNKRNVLGFAFDFDEEHTKSNWGVEASWISKQTFVNNDEYDGISDVDTLSLTVSVDRPTFINFLNQGRTFFFNSQWFFQYINDYNSAFYSNGPLNVLATLTVFTGYHQDRLMLYTTAVYDFNSNSGALLPSVTYRFTESFSASIGVNVFWGHQQLHDAAINEIRPALNRTGNHAYQDAVDNGLAALRDRDEMNLTIRYTF